MPISFSTAALGGEIDVPTLAGKAAIDIPEGTQSGAVFRRIEVLSGRLIPQAARRSYRASGPATGWLANALLLENSLAQ